jgi:hypothetical protein
MASNGQMLQLQVPPGCTPGQAIQLRHPVTGVLLQTTIPLGLQVGDTFQIPCQQTNSRVSPQNRILTQQQQQLRPLSNQYNPPFDNYQISNYATICTATTFDFTYLEQAAPVLGLTAEEVKKTGEMFNKKYTKQKWVFFVFGYGCMSLFWILGMTVSPSLMTQFENFGHPEQIKCNGNGTFSEIYNTTNGLWCCPIVPKDITETSTIQDIQKELCLPINARDEIKTGQNGKWVLQKAYTSYTEKSFIGTKNSCECTIKGSAPFSCTDTIYVMPNGFVSHFTFVDAYEKPGLQSVLEYLLVLLTILPCIISSFVCWCNKKVKMRIIDKSFHTFRNRGIRYDILSAGSFYSTKITIIFYPTVRQQQQQQQLQQQVSSRINQIVPQQSRSPNPDALNQPGYWDVFISHTQRNAEGKLLALDLHNSLAVLGKTSWLDVKMDKMSMDAMEEGVKNASCIIAIITDRCITEEDASDKGPEQNAYFNRWMCLQELRWAIKYGVPIQPVIRVEDKKKIGDFIKMAPDDLRFLGGVDWKHIDRSNKRYFDLGVDMLLEGVKDLILQKQNTVRQQDTVQFDVNGETKDEEIND